MGENEVILLQQTLSEFQQALDQLNAGNEKIFKKLDKLEDKVYNDHSRKLQELKDLTPSEKDIERFQAVVTAFGNWKFLFKFFGVLGTVFTACVTILYYLIQFVKMIR